jgi:hypothetical protein
VVIDATAAEDDDVSRDADVDDVGNDNTVAGSDI